MDPTDILVPVIDVEGAIIVLGDANLKTNQYHQGKLEMLKDIDRYPKICLGEEHIKMISHRAAIVEYLMSDRDTSHAEYAYAKGYQQAIKDLLNQK